MGELVGFGGAWKWTLFDAMVVVEDSVAAAFFVVVFIGLRSVFGWGIIFVYGIFYGNFTTS